MALLLLYLLCIIPLLQASECPNKEFRVVARYRQSFQLDAKHNRYWVAFGSKGKWAIELVDTKFNEKRQTFKCKATYWASVQPINHKEAKKEDAVDKPLCCAAPHTIDLLPEGETTTNPFAVLTDAHAKALRGKGSPTLTATEPVGEDQTHYFWMLGLTSVLRERVFYRWRRVKSTKRFYDGLKKKGMLLNAGAQFKSLPDIATEGSLCFASDSDECDTGITTDIVAFEIQCDKYSHIRFGFSSDGIFSVPSFLQCIGFGKKAAEDGIYYYPVTRLFDTAEPPQARPAYNSIGLGWKLGSFCASCPSTSVVMAISESEARMNKKRLQHSLGIGGTLGTGKDAPVAASGSVQYTRMWFKEASETVTSGRATTITAVCNGFYLWYWTVSVGTWGEGDSVVPTQLFYCSDRGTPPVCKPRIAGARDTDAFGKLCNGHDVVADFVESSHDVANEWQSMHAGRPKPIRLQGQRNQGSSKEEPSFKVIQAAHESGYGDYMDDDDAFVAEKGIFFGRVTFDDDEMDHFIMLESGEEEHKANSVYMNDVMLPHNEPQPNQSQVRDVLMSFMASLIGCVACFGSFGLAFGWYIGWLKEKSDPLEKNKPSYTNLV